MDSIAQTQVAGQAVIKQDISTTTMSMRRECRVNRSMGQPVLSFELTVTSQLASHLSLIYRRQGGEEPHQQVQPPIIF
jgi:hypothetical protein